MDSHQIWMRVLPSKILRDAHMTRVHKWLITQELSIDTTQHVIRYFSNSAAPGMYKPSAQSQKMIKVFIVRAGVV